MKVRLINKTGTPFCVRGVMLKPYSGSVTEIPDDFKYDSTVLAVIPISENKVKTETIVKTTTRSRRSTRKRKNTI